MRGDRVYRYVATYVASYSVAPPNNLLLLIANLEIGTTPQIKAYIVKVSTNGAQKCQMYDLLHALLAFINQDKCCINKSISIN